MENIGIKVCADKDVVMATLDGIMQILNSKVDNETMRVAMNVLGKSASADYASISNVSISMGDFSKITSKEEEEKE